VHYENSSDLSAQPICSTTATSASPAANYPITFSGGSAMNYTFSYMPGILSIHYLLSGICLGEAGHQILQPINADGSSVFNSKSTSPAKFRVCDTNGVSIGTPGVVRDFRLVQVVSGTATNMNETVDSTTPDTTFRWDPSAQQWIFNISNKGLYGPNQTYYFVITLNDGTMISFDYGLK